MRCLKDIFAFFIGFICILPGYSPGKVVKSDTFTKTIYKFDLDDLVFEQDKFEEKDFSKISLTGLDGYEGITTEIGAPELPVIRFFFLGDRPISVVSSDEEPFEVKRTTSLAIRPHQPPRSKSDEKSWVFYQDDEIYHKNFFFPPQEYLVEKVGSIRGQNKMLITLFPIQYNPSSGQIKMRRHFRIETPRVVNRERENGKRMVFLIGEKFKDNAALKKYIKFKATQSITGEKLLVAGDLLDPVNLRNNLMKIFQKRPFDYIMIIGDHEQVPGAKPTQIVGITDHFYRSLDNPNYKEDLGTPDVSVGRLSVSSPGELKTVIDKLIRYQTKDFQDSTWLSRASFIATDDEWKIVEKTHNYVIKNFTVPNKYSGDFPSPDEKGGDKLYAITNQARTDDVLNALVQGRAIVNYSGHGSDDRWVSPELTIQDLGGLTNQDAFPFVVANACLTANFSEKESLGEAFLKHPHGAIAYWGSMDSTFWEEDNILEKKMYEGVFRKGKRTFAEITEYALDEFWRHYGGRGESKYYWETYVSLGDPSLKILTN